MKTVITVLATLLLSNTAQAGAYSFDCESKDKSIILVKGQFASKKLGIKIEYSESDTQYLSDSKASLDSYTDIQDTLKSKNKVYVDMPYEVGGKDNKKVVTLDKDFKTSCGDDGHITKFNQIVRVLDMSGNEIVPPTRIYCRDRFESGHCI